jgi:hypothetical protein
MGSTASVRNEAACAGAWKAGIECSLLAVVPCAGWVNATLGVRIHIEAEDDLDDGRAG